MVGFDRYNGSCKTLDDPSGRVFVLNKTEDGYLNVFNMITKINESKTLRKYLIVKKVITKKWNKDKCQCERKNPIKHRV